ncbi:CDP-alcohol phosphatidyltransferase [Angustibacter aerolatus]|uniref:CDP-alcohol phosphatidyltransferase n=1 Tax=Angustibacter aerolatus TaxID=1162965 RepID=A0ABQ6JEJ8_9ACTN|nr:CDP-alcohol phosphatidyltransferase family protein [Angustibacter aerolatus]GMA86234.1 CDP-alcohol phosphatidyltransferase [Angustibacter aerolatus]
MNRPLGRSFAAGAYLLGRTPNQVTALSAVFTYTAIALVFLVRPVWWTGLVVAALLVIGYALDAADGQARPAARRRLAAGEWLDHMFDAGKASLLHLAVLVSAYRFFDLDDRWLLVPMGFAAVASVMFFGMILNDLLRQRQVAATGVPIERGGTSGLRSLLVIPTDYGFLCVAFVLLGVPAVFFPVYVLFFVANAGFLVLAVVKWFRDMGALGRPVPRQSRGQDA